MRLLIIITFSAFLGLGTGWTLRHLNIGKGTPESARKADSTSTTTTTAAADKTLAKEESATLTSPENDASGEAPRVDRVERWFIMAQAAESGNLQGFPGLMRASNGEIAVQRMIVAQWIERDPTGMWRWLSNSNATLPGVSRKELAELLFEGWAAKDPEGVLASMAGASSFPNMQQLRSEILPHLMKSNPALAMLALEEWDFGTAQPIWNSKELGDWALQDPQKAVGQLLQIKGKASLVRKALSTIGDAWGQRNPQAALAFSKSLPAPYADEFASSALDKWVKSDMKGAMAYHGTLQDSMVKVELAFDIVQEWNKTAPAEALTWGLANLKGQFRQKLSGMLISSKARENVSEAIAMVDVMEPGASKEFAVHQTVLAAAQQSSPAVLNWLIRLRNEGEVVADQEFLNLAAHWPDQNVPEAMDMLTRPEGAAIPANFTHHIVERAMANSPGQAMEWISKLPPDKLPAARATGLKSWLGRDQKSAQAWLDAQPKAIQREVQAIWDLGK